MLKNVLESLDVIDIQKEMARLFRTSTSQFIITNITPSNQKKGHFFYLTLSPNALTLVDHQNENIHTLTFDFESQTLEVNGHNKGREFNSAFISKLKKLINYFEAGHSEVYTRKKLLVPAFKVSMTKKPKENKKDLPQTLSLLINEKVLENQEEAKQCQALSKANSDRIFKALRALCDHMATH